MLLAEDPLPPFRQKRKKVVVGLLHVRVEPAFTLLGFTQEM